MTKSIKFKRSNPSVFGVDSRSVEGIVKDKIEVVGGDDPLASTDEGKMRFRGFRLG